MKNFKFRGIPREKDEFRRKILKLDSMAKTKFLAQNSAVRGKLWALVITDL